MRNLATLFLGHEMRVALHGLSVAFNPADGVGANENPDFDFSDAMATLAVAAGQLEAIDWDSAPEEVLAALDNHVGLLASLGFQFALRTPGGKMLDRLAELVEKLCRIRPTLPALTAQVSAARNSSQPAWAMETAYSAFRGWYQGVVEPDDPSAAYVPPAFADLMRYISDMRRRLFDLEVEDMPAATPVHDMPSVRQTGVNPPEIPSAARADLHAPLDSARRGASQRLTAGSEPALERNYSVGKRVRISTDAMIGAGALIDDDAYIGRFAQIGAKAHIGPGVTVPASQLVAPGAVVTAIDLRADTKLHEGCELHGNLTLTSKTKVKRACVFLGDVHFAGRIVVNNVVTFSAGARVNSWAIPEATRGLTAGGSLYVEEGGKVGSGVTVGAEVLVQKKARLGEGVKIGSYVNIPPHISVGAGATIGDCLRITRKVPTGAVVTAAETTRHGQTIEHCAVGIAAFELTKAGTAVPLPMPLPMLLPMSITPSVAGALSPDSALPVTSAAVSGPSTKSSAAALGSAATGTAEEPAFSFFARKAAIKLESASASGPDAVLTPLPTATVVPTSHVRKRGRDAFETVQADSCKRPKHQPAEVRAAQPDPMPSSPRNERAVVRVPRESGFAAEISGTPTQAMSSTGLYLSPYPNTRSSVRTLGIFNS